MTRSFGWCYVRVDEQMELLSCGSAVKLLQEREVCLLNTTTAAAAGKRGLITTAAAGKERSV